MALPLRRQAGPLAAVVALVALVAGASLLFVGASAGQALAGSLLAGLFALVVCPLVVIARRVGSATDDPAVLERRIGAAAGRSPAELDALADWDERRGRLDDASDRESEDW